jgi:hypothetical protein
MFKSCTVQFGGSRKWASIIWGSSSCCLMIGFAFISIIKLLTAYKKKNKRIHLTVSYAILIVDTYNSFICSLTYVHIPPPQTLLEEQRWADTDRIKPVSVPLCPPQIPRRLSWAQTRASAVRSAGATARPTDPLALRLRCIYLSSL